MVKQKGFTYIQLVIVMTLMATVAATVGVLWPNKKINIIHQAERLAGDIRYVRYLAQTRNDRTRINFSAGSYSLFEADGTTPIMQPALNSNTVNMPAGVTISTSGSITNGYLVFDALGRPYVTNGSPGTLLSSDGVITLSADGETETVTVTAGTGQVQ